MLDETRGWIIEQHLLDAANRQLASARATGFQYDQMLGVSLPRQVQIRLPTAQLNFTLQTDQHMINQLIGAIRPSCGRCRKSVAIRMSTWIPQAQGPATGRLPAAWQPALASTRIAVCRPAKRCDSSPAAV